MSLADKVIVMSDAVVQQVGTSREVHENPQTKFVAEFIGSNNLFQGRIRSRSGSIVLSRRSDGRFTSRYRRASGRCRSARTSGSPFART